VLEEKKERRDRWIGDFYPCGVGEWVKRYQRLLAAGRHV